MKNPFKLFPKIWWDSEPKPHPTCTYDSLYGGSRMAQPQYEGGKIKAMDHGHVLFCSCGRWKFFSHFLETL